MAGDEGAHVRPLTSTYLALWIRSYRAGQVTRPAPRSAV
jgi:hypothetical protein